MEQKLLKYGNFIEFCQISLEKDIVDHFNLSKGSGVIVLKRNRELSSGDFLVVVKQWKLNTAKCKPHTHSDHPRYSHIDVVQNVSSDHSENDSGQNKYPEKHLVSETNGKDDINKELILERLTDHVFTEVLPFHVNVISVSNNCDIFLKLNRSHVYSTVFANVLNQREKYGRFMTKHRICIHISDVGTSLDDIRTLLLSEHITALLQANGYDVDQMKHKPSAEEEVLYRNLGLEWQTSTNTDETPNSEATKEDVLRRLHASSYYEDPDIDLHSFLNDKGLTEKYDQNISSVAYLEDSERLKKLVFLEHQYRNSTKPADTYLHIVGQRQAIMAQTVEIAWTMINDHTSLKQVHLSHAPVSNRQCNRQVPTALELLELRTDAVRCASVMKYGEEVQGSSWKQRIDTLAIAAVKFDLLSTTYSRPVKLDISDGCKDTLDSHPGVFMMYNCARLATLLHKYQHSVDIGVYPALPDIDTLDFSLLREEDEWVLLFNYILLYPTMIQDCVCKNNAGNTTIHTHKVCQFLQDLSRDLSAYYCRTHILTEARDHLLPVMFCRLYLLKSLQQVLHNCLQLLNITPVTQL